MLMEEKESSGLMVMKKLDLTRQQALITQLIHGRWKGFFLIAPQWAQDKLWGQNPIILDLKFSKRIT